MPNVTRTAKHLQSHLVNCISSVDSSPWLASPNIRYDLFCCALVWFLCVFPYSWQLSVLCHPSDSITCRGLRSDVDSIFRRLRTCEQSHQGVAEQINSWRTLFSAAGTSVACQQQDASEQMQISPVGAEGSNVMPGQPARAEAAEVRRQGVQNSLLTHVGRDGTPHAGSTAGEGAHPSTAMCLHPAKPAGKVKHAGGLLSCLLLQQCTCGKLMCELSLVLRRRG